MIENLIELSDDSLQSVLCVLSNRFLKKRIYTSVGDHLIFVNPNEVLPIYDESVLAQYSPPKDRRQHNQQGSPHIFALVAKALKRIENGSSHETLIFCGESGSGKTSNLFHALHFICSMSDDNNATSRVTVSQVDALKTICQAFGGAKTLKNENSTRFGYAVNVGVKNGVVADFGIVPVVLPELSRLVIQRKGDFNFDVFYQLCAGLDADGLSRYGLKQVNNYFYLNQGKCNIDCAKAKAKFEKLCEALSTIGFSEDQVELIFATLSAILHIGNLFFYTQKTPNDEEYAEVANENVLQWIAHLLSVDYALIRAIFASSPKITSDDKASDGASSVELKSVDQALDLRDAFAKILYDGLFKWIFSRISLFFQSFSVNNARNGGGAETGSNVSGRIKLFDMFGFEKYGTNSYEEFCVNVANEKLVNFYFRTTFASSEDGGSASGDAEEELHNPSQVVNGRRVIELLTKRPSGLIPLLDDECKFPRGSDETLLQQYNLNHLNKSIYLRARVKDRVEFGVKHHAGIAFYAVDGFLAKNRWTAPAAVFAALARSRDALLVHAFGGGRGVNAAGGKLQSSSVALADETIYIVSELCKSVNAVCDRLQRSSCSFVHCLRSNNDRHANRFDPELVERQLKALALAELCRLLRHAYVRSLTFDEFSDQLRCLLPDDITRGRTALEITHSVLETQGAWARTDARVLDTRVTLKETLWQRLLELKHFTRNVAALILQRNLRKWLTQRSFLRLRDATVVLQAGWRGWKARKEVSKRKEYLLETIQKEKCFLTVRPESLSSITQTGSTTTSSTRLSQQTPSCFAELPPEVQQCFEAERTEGGAVATSAENVGQVTHYIPLKMSVPKPVVNSVTIEEFAAQHLKHHVLGIRREPIFTPFLPKASEADFNSSLKLFKLILYYMNDGTLNAAQLVILAKYIVQQGIDNTALRDELYVQLCNQTYRNTNAASAARAWNLLLMAVNAFPPGILVFPMLYSYFKTAQPQSLSEMLLESLVWPLRIPKGRLHAPTKLEQIALTRRQPNVLNATLYGEDRVPTAVNAYTTADEFLQRVLRHRSIADSTGWCLKLSDSRETVQIFGDQYLFDAIAEFESPQCQLRRGGKTCQSSNEDVMDNLSPFAFFDVVPCVKQKFGGGGGQRYASRGGAPKATSRVAAASSSLLSSSPLKTSEKVESKQRDHEDLPILSKEGYVTASEHSSFSPSATDWSQQHSGMRLRRFDASLLRGFKKETSATGCSSLTEESLAREAVSAANITARRLNPNCMSRITEEDGASIDGGSRIFDFGRRQPVGSNRGESELVDRILASIKGGGLRRDADNYNYFGGAGGGSTDERGSVSDYGPLSPRSPPSLHHHYRGSDGGTVGRGLSPPPTRYYYQPQQQAGGGIYRMDGRATNSGGTNSLPIQQPPLNNTARHNQYSMEEQPSKFDPRLFMRSTTSTLNAFPMEDYPMESSTTDYNNNSNYGSQQSHYQSRSNMNGGSVMDENNYYSTFNEMKHTRSAWDQPQNNQSSPLMGKKESGLKRYPQAPISIADQNSAHVVHGDYYFAARPIHPPPLPPPANIPIDEEEFFGNEWLHEAELPYNWNNATIMAGANANDANDYYGERGTPPTDYECVMMSPATSHDVSGAEEQNKSTSPSMIMKNLPAVEWTKSPLTITVRKEIFAVDEVLDDGAEIDVIFAQIIADCRRNVPYRIRKYERETINQILRSYNVPPSSLDHLSEIGTRIKIQVIDAVRRWPLYFCRLFPIIEERPNDRVPMYLGVGETGIRLISFSQANASSDARNNSKSLKPENAVIIQDHFEFSDISELVIERQRSLRLITRQSISVLITSVEVEAIKNCIERYINGTVKCKEFVVTNADYLTKEPNLLSFRRGQFVQLIRNNAEATSGALAAAVAADAALLPTSGGQWLYGKLENRFGWFPADYVQPIDVEEQYSNDDMEPNGDDVAKAGNNRLINRQQMLLPKHSKHFPASAPNS